MFVLKKIVSEMLMPLPLALELLFAGILLLWFTRRQVMGKAIATAAMLLLLVEGFGVFAGAVLQKLEGMYHPVDVQEAKAARVRWIVVLASGHARDDSLPATAQLSAETQVRLNEGIRIYRRLPHAKLLVSGGRVFGTVPTSGLMARLAAELGVDPGDIVQEDRSRDTGQEADLIRPVVGAGPFILVTSAYHMPRAMALFRDRGMQPVADPTGYYGIEPDAASPMSFFPRAQNVYTCEIVVHEILGLLALQLHQALS